MNSTARPTDMNWSPPTPLPHWPKTPAVCGTPHAPLPAKRRRPSPRATDAPTPETVTFLAFLTARLEQEQRLHGDRIAAIGLYPRVGTGFDVQVYLTPAEPGLVDEEYEDGLDGVGDLPNGTTYRPEIVVPRQEVETEGRSHALHETYTDVATRGLIRSLADDLMTALTVTVARMFTVLALQGSASTDQSASTLQGRRYSRGALPPAPALDGVVRSRLAERRDAYLASGQRRIPWVGGLPHGEKMAFLAELIAVSLDLRGNGVGYIRRAARAARAEAVEIAELLDHDIAAYWTPDTDFLGRHTKAQLLAALEAMGADATPTKGMKKEELVGYVASVAAEKGWAPTSLSLRTEDDVGHAEDGGGAAMTDAEASGPGPLEEATVAEQRVVQSLPLRPDGQAPAFRVEACPVQPVGCGCLRRWTTTSRTSRPPALRPDWGRVGSGRARDEREEAPPRPRRASPVHERYASPLRAVRRRSRGRRSVRQHPGLGADACDLSRQVASARSQARLLGDDHDLRGGGRGGAWSWRDAYDAVEVAQVLQIRRLGPQVGRLEDAPAEITALLAALSALTPTHTRRSEERVALDQFSTPPELAAVAVAAAQVRPGDRVLEPSAGTGLLAIVAEVCGGEVCLNELSAHRAGLLDGVFPLASRTRHDAALLPDLLPKAGAFHAAVMNPPFQDLDRHLHAALRCLADGDRFCAFVPARLFDDRAAMEALSRRGLIVARIVAPARAFARHGTGVETGLLVIDRGDADAAPAAVSAPGDLSELARAAALPHRPTAQPRSFRQVSQAALLQPRARDASQGSNRLNFLAASVPVAYETKPWAGERRDVGLYCAYGVSRLAFGGVAGHPSPLVKSAAMASTPPPAPTYRPLLPPALIEGARVSDAQMESVVYAGEAHAAPLPGWWRHGDAPHLVELTTEGSPGAAQFRRGYFVGDGTGVGKGRLAASIIADNMAQGRWRAVWVSKNEALLEDARRDWCGIGGGAADLTPQSAWKQSDAIRLDRGILFTTYATLRQPPRRGGRSRLEQITDWLGADFDGVVIFDEAHALANAAGGGKGFWGARRRASRGRRGWRCKTRFPTPACSMSPPRALPRRRTWPTRPVWGSGADRKRPSTPARTSSTPSSTGAWR